MHLLLFIRIHCSIYIEQLKAVNRWGLPAVKGIDKLLRQNRCSQMGKWSSRVIENLCKDLQSGFPGLKGFSRANAFYMRAFYNIYAKIQQDAGQLETPLNFCPVLNNLKEFLIQALYDAIPYCFYQLKNSRISEGIIGQLSLGFAKMRCLMRAIAS